MTSLHLNGSNIAKMFHAVLANQPLRSLDDWFKLEW
jgi:hypothetical protein